MGCYVRLEELLYNKEYWEKSYNRLSEKPYLRKDDKENLSSWLSNYLDIVSELISNNYEFSIPEKLLLAKPNGGYRTVYMFSLRERFIMGAVFRVLTRYFSNFIEPNCFAYQSGLSTIDAVNYLKRNSDIVNNI